MTTRDRPHESAVARRELALWPRLDRPALRRCGDDPDRIAMLVARRTSLPRQSILRLRAVPPVNEDEGSTWFG